MKKLIIFAAIIVVLFGALAFVTIYQNKEEAEGNPYNKEQLRPETIKQLDDPNYKNQILPEELNKIIEEKQDATIYFYSPTCPHCRVTSPVVVPLSKDMNIDLKMFNLLEFEDGWTQYNIESTPTIVRYKNGKEVDRIVGSQEEDVFKKWFNETK
ncbi:thioredoxin family protein [Priestia abyssalis]|uniref:thioredoxin family protein n=1 Tax=Priestia abyssalis TaxID=1221450 RepID=UPI00099498EC|nr:thioredoxin family protein [Priestia abyssalis]